MNLYLVTRSHSVLIMAENQEEAESYMDNGCECYNAYTVSSRAISTRAEKIIIDSCNGL